MNPFTLLSMMLNATLTFFATALCMESLLILFRVKSRVSSLMRLVPFVLMLLEPLLNNFSWLNPLICNSCLQQLILKLFYSDLSNYLSTNEISLVNYLASMTPYCSLLMALLCFISGIFFLKSLFPIFLQKNFLQKIQGKPADKIVNQTLAQALNTVTIIESEQIDIPMAYKNIFMPKNLTLEQGEYEAIIAHELEHIIWKDPEVRLALHLISGLFWWVPLQWWIKKIIHDQEMACDRSILKYGLEATSLASSLMKFIKERNNNLCAAFSYKYSSSLLRLQALLGTMETIPKAWGIFGMALESALFFIVCN